MAKFATFFHGKLSGIEITCVQSFLDHGHEVTIYAYEGCHAPPHFTVADASRILPRSELFFYKSGEGKGSVSGFSNLFRYTLLSKSEKTWWIDTDVICLTAAWPEVDRIGAAWEHEAAAGSAVLYLNPALGAEIATRAGRMGRDVVWGQNGPTLLTSFIHEKNLPPEILRTSTFYPLPYQDWYLPFIANCTDRVSELCVPAYALHLWHEMGRRSGFNKNVKPGDGSFVGQLIEKHGTGKYFASPSNYREDVSAARSWESAAKGVALAIEGFIRPLDAKLQHVIETQARLSNESAGRDEQLENSIGTMQSALKNSLELSFENFKYDIAREVWFEKQRWGLPYKFWSAWRRKFPKA